MLKSVRIILRNNFKFQQCKIENKYEIVRLVMKEINNEWRCQSPPNVEMHASSQRRQIMQGFSLF